MTNQFACLIFILATGFSYAQPTYKFDYVLEYETTLPAGKDPEKTFKSYWFISSTDNSAMLLVQENASQTEVYMKLYMGGGIAYYSSMPRGDFFVEAISLKCPPKLQPGNLSKLKNIENVMHSDTIIDTQAYAYRTLKYSKPEGAVVAEHYIIDNSLGLSAPALPSNDTAYRIWEKQKDFPAGVVKEWYETDASNKIVIHSRLIQSIKLKKIIMVDRNCR